MIAQSEVRRWSVPLILAVIFVAVALLAPAARAETWMYWGGTIKGETYGLGTDAPNDPAILERFERDAGKEVTFINTGAGWASFETATMNATISEGALPLVTMPLDGVSLAEVAAGKQDEQIRAWARAARAFGYPFLFRPWWEPNDDWYSWGRSPDYVAAWRHFHDVVEEVGATNVTWDWVVNAVWNDSVADPTAYYPGAEYVDWVGMDAYNWGQNPLQPARWLTAEEAIQPTLEVLEKVAPGKPVCICEDASTEIGGDKAAWLREMLGTYLPAHPEIKAYLYFNWNAEQADKPGQHWDWPIESSEAAELAFREGIQAPTYLSHLPPLQKLAKVPIPAPPPLITPPSTPVAVPPSPVPSAARSASPSRRAAKTCEVPKLLGLRLKAARRKLRAAECRVGAVTARQNARAGTAAVIRQTPAAGKLVARRARVAVRLG